MRFHYKFHNVLGSVYDRGNLQFYPTGDRLLSPCGNKIILYDLKNGSSEALPFEVQFNITRISLNPDCTILLLVTERNQLLIVSMLSQVILHRKDFKHIGETIHDLKFSPDGKYYAVCGSTKVLVYLTPGYMSGGSGTRQLSPFKIHKMIQASYEESTSISWNHSSQLLLVTSKDFSMRIYPIDREIVSLTNFLTLTAHNDLIIGAFFANTTNDPLDIFSLSRSGQLFAWKSNLETLEKNQETNDDEKLNYTIENKKFMLEDLKEKNSGTRITAYAYQEKAKMLVTGFTDGQFMLYDLTDMILIHSLQLSTKSPISAMTFNPTGHWIAIGSSVGTGTKYDLEKEVSTQTQLVVWEWQSESFVLKQSGYSNSVTNTYECLAYSPDASLMVTGGTDGRLKIWNLYSGFCLSTFSTEHKGPITAVEFVHGKDGKVFLSCSLDGTVKAFDLNRYRCFRTLAAPSDSKPAQFISLAVDKIGSDFVAAGSHNFFEIFLWSLKTGRLVEMLSGHEGPVSGLKFSPNSNTLYSCSWDCTVRIWNLFEGPKCTREVIKLGSDALSLDIRDNGSQFAVATLNGSISFFNAQTGDQLGVEIEGRNDLGTVRYKTEEINDRQKYFSTLCYSVDGEYILAAGKSKFVCIYHVNEKMLVKRFQISNNLSLDGFSEFINKRKIQEFGFNLDLLKHRSDDSSWAPIALPGVIRSDYADREMTPIIAVHQIRFSPTMRTFAMASTEGVIIYSLDKTDTFDPIELDTSITSSTFQTNLSEGNFTMALIHALKLNESEMIEEAIESVPLDQIVLVSSSLSVPLVRKLLLQMAKTVEKTRHIEFYMRWITSLLSQNFSAMKSFPTSDQTAMLRLLYQAINHKYQDLSKIVNHNRYNLRFVQILAKHHSQPDSNSENDKEENEPMILGVEED